MTNNTVLSAPHLYQLLASQIVLVTATAAGQTDYFEVLIIYALEMIIVALIALIFFTDSAHLLQARISNLVIMTIGATFMIFLNLFAWHNDMGPDGQSFMSLDSIGAFLPALPSAAAYFCVRFGWAWFSASRTSDPRYTFLPASSTPLLSLCLRC